MAGDFTLDTPLWHYALKLYSQPGVESAALTLQQTGLSINRLLFACWLAREGLELDPGYLQGDALEWQQTLTHPLRTLRYRVRGQKTALPELEGCYRKLREAELAAEQVELWLLWRQVERCQARPDRAGSALAWRNLHRLFEADEALWQRLQPQLAVLVGQGFGPVGEN